ncbi:MAG: DMT family transporter [Candidatus Hodarchaeota archaeon]
MIEAIERINLLHDSTEFQIDKQAVYVGLAGILWGTSFPAITFGLNYVSAELLLFLRFLIATVITIALYPQSVRKALTIRTLAILGLMSGTGYLLQVLGQGLILPGLTSMLVNSYVIIAPIFSYFIIGEKLTIRKIGAAIIGLFGVLLITNPSPEIIEMSFEQHLLGILLILGAGLVWGLYVTFSKKVQNQNPQITDSDIFVATMIYSLNIACLMLSFGTFSRCMEQNNFNLIEIGMKLIVDLLNPTPLLAAVYLGIFCSVIPSAIYLRALNNIDVGISTIILLLEVVVSYTISIAFFGEVMGIIQILGSIFLVGGIILVMIEPRAELKEN